MNSPTRTASDRPQIYSSETKTEMATAAWTKDRRFPPRWEPLMAPVSDVDMAVM